MAAYNPFKKKVTAVDQPSPKAVTITPSDSTDLLIATRSLYIGVAGDLAVIMADDNTDSVIIFKAISGFCPIMVKRIMATQTDADNIIALY